jgi:Spy/CpxP family protein refolding chaperone
MKIHQTFAAFVLAAALLTSGALPALSQSKSCGHHPGSEKQCSKSMGYIHPELSKEQQEAIKKLDLEYKKEMLRIKNHIAEKKAHIKSLSVAEEVDINTIHANIDEMYHLKSMLAKKQAERTQNIRKLMNDEQRLHFDLKKSGERSGYKEGCCGMCSGASGCCQQGGQKGGGCCQQGNMHHNKGGGCQHQGEGMRGNQDKPTQDKKK